MGNEHCPICGADAETPDKAFFYYECGFTVNRQSGAVIRHCKNEELVEANKRIAALEAENAALREVVQTLRKSLAPYWPVARFDLTAQEILALKTALEAAGLVEEEQDA